MRWLLEGAESSSQLLGKLWWGPGISYLVKSQVWTSYLRNSLACLCLCEASGRLAQLLNRLSVLRPGAGGESHSLCVCLWVWIPATGTNQELTGFKQRHTSRNDRKASTNHTTIYRRICKVWGKPGVEAYSRTYRFKQSSGQPHKSGYWTNDLFMDLFWKQRSHKGGHLESFSREKGTKYTTLHCGCLQGKRWSSSCFTSVRETLESGWHGVWELLGGHLQEAVSSFKSEQN